jgi:hypothetical protein
MTSLSQWSSRCNRLKATTPGPTKAVTRACTIRLRPTAMRTAMIPSSAPIPATCPDGNGWLLGTQKRCCFGFPLRSVGAK